MPRLGEKFTHRSGPPQRSGAGSVPAQRDWPAKARVSTYWVRCSYPELAGVDDPGARIWRFQRASASGVAPAFATPGISTGTHGNTWDLTRLSPFSVVMGRLWRQPAT